MFQTYLWDDFLENFDGSCGKRHVSSHFTIAARQLTACLGPQVRKRVCFLYLLQFINTCLCSGRSWLARNRTRKLLSLVSQSDAAYSRSHLARFACARFALRTHKNFRKKKSLSRSTRNALKRIEMQKKILSLWPIAQSPSGVAQWNFNTIDRIKVSTFSPSLIKIRPIVSEI